MEIFCVFTFDAAHKLPHVSSDHKCGRLHGHTFTVEIHVEGSLGTETGWVVDFFDIKKAFEPIREILDHNYLNDIEGLANPTSENIAQWIMHHLKPRLPNLSKVVVKETPTSGAICSARGKRS